MARTWKVAVASAGNPLAGETGWKAEEERLAAEEQPAGKGRASSTATHPPISASLGNGIWQTQSWTGSETYEQNLGERTCTCAAGKKGFWCKHLTSALLASFTLQVRKARAADGVIVRGLLNRGVHKGRPDIEMALLLVAWEEAQAAWAKLQAEEPGGDDPPPGGEVLTAAEYESAVALLSEGRRQAA